jgi:hypothetical protein
MTIELYHTYLSKTDLISLYILLLTQYKDANLFSWLDLCNEKSHTDKTQEVVPLVYENGTVRVMVVFETRGPNFQINFFIENKKEMHICTDKNDFKYVCCIYSSS